MLVWALAAAVPLGTVRAAEPAPRTTGHVLLLENERTVEGRIEKEDDHYRVHREAGETDVPAAQVLCLCDSLEEAYAVLRERTNLRDPDERVRLARWCHLHGLRAQALAEITAAAELRPHHAESQRLLQTFRRSAASAPAARAAARPAGDEAAAPPVEVSAELLGQFVTRVQPVLMNTCAACHVADHGGSFRLVRALEGGVVNRRATQHNLNAVLAQVNRDHWEASPLLARAVSVHGQANQPPLKGRQTPAFRNLEDWVRGAVANHGPPSEHASAPPVAVSSTPAEVGPAALFSQRPEAAGELVSSTLPVAPAGPPPPAGTPSIPPATGPAGAASPPPAPTPTPVDPFDPVIFNQQAHPAKESK
jgi:hypothetical protein